jgi:hypothetical protein
MPYLSHVQLDKLDGLELLLERLLVEVRDGTSLLISLPDSSSEESETLVRLNWYCRLSIADWS